MVVAVAVATAGRGRGAAAEGGVEEGGVGNQEGDGEGRGAQAVLCEHRSGEVGESECGGVGGPRVSVVLVVVVD